MELYKKIVYMCVAMACFTTANPANADKNFPNWVEKFKKDAYAQGISKSVVDAAMKGVKPIPRIIELDRKQPEGTISFAKYKKNVLNQARIDKGRKLYKQHREMLESIATKYGVPAPYIVSLWGIETSFGANTGGFGVVNSLSTLAYDGRRSEYFRAELINALKILDAGHISLDKMKGSWAGAMGQNQFMPTSFHAFAVDENGDGHRDIWTTLPDVFASTANYLSKSGWKADERWGRAVKASRALSKDEIGLDHKRSLVQWRKIGITLPDGSPLPTVNGLEASLVAPDGVNGSLYLVYDNYRVIMKWNKSTYFATSVGLLADFIAQ